MDFVRFEFSLAVLLRIQLFCNVMHCRWLVVFRRSDRTHCLHF